MKLEINEFEVMQIEIDANQVIKDYRKNLGLSTPDKRIDAADIKCVLSVMIAHGFSIVREPKEKGDYNGECNRTVCKNGQAVFLNQSTQKHYCQTCADLLNKENYADAQRLYGTLLCLRM